MGVIRQLGWHAVQQRQVLYLDCENPLCIAKQRLFDLGIPETNYLQVWSGWVCLTWHFSQSRWIQRP